MLGEISDQTAIELRALIERSLSPESETDEPVGGGASQDFCSLWPEARPILQAIVAGASGAGAFFAPLAAAGPVLAALVATGEAVYHSTCKAA